MHQCAHHHPPGQAYGRAFAIGVILNLAFVGVEAFFGWYTGSLALLADAGHNLSDVLGLLLGVVMRWLNCHPVDNVRMVGVVRQYWVRYSTDCCCWSLWVESRGKHSGVFQSRRKFPLGW